MTLLPLGAQTTFTSAPHAAGANPGAVATADLDGDGDVDAAHAHAAFDQVRANLNTGGGAAFANGPLFTYPVGSRPVELVIDAFNSGRPDVAVMLAGSGQVAIHLATGAWPGFAAPQLVPMTGPIEAVSFDVELDGDRDLAVLCQGPPRVEILRNTGGVFAPVLSIPLSVGPHAITAGNFNGNGPNDLVVTGSAGTAFADVLLNQTVGAAVAFSPEQLFGVDFRPFGVCSGDFNGDGLTDIATANAAFSTVTVLLNDPTAVSTVTVGMLASTYPMAPGVVAGPATEIECADMDCDGDVDLGVACNASNSTNWYWNIGGGGTFVTPTYAAAAGPGAGDLALADFSGDGWLDAVTADTTANTITVQRNNFGAGCCRHVFIGGIIDGFSLATPFGAEEACPGPDLSAFFTGPTRDFDGPVVCSEVFMHTFSDLPTDIKSARVRIGVRADCTSPGDVFGLGFETSTNWFSYIDTMGNLTSSPWTAGSTSGFAFDLANLPGGINLLPKMAADGRLDFFNRSNTAFDYIYLEIETCARSRPAMNLNVDPYVTPGVLGWNVSGGPASGVAAIFLSPFVGPGPIIGTQQMCLTAPTFLALFPLTGSGTGTLSIPFGVPFPPPCVTLSSQAVAVGGGSWFYSNTNTQQLFD
ncbi:MAG: VCBS repeat-containing protein [Planctomycetota bacterium]